MSIRFMRCTDATKSASTKVLESGQPLYNPDTSELFIGDGEAQAKALKTVTPFVASEGAYTALLGTANTSKGDRSVVVGHGNNITTTAEYANNIVVGANNTCHQISGGTIGASNKIGSDVAIADGSISYRGYTVTYKTAKGYSNNSLVVGAANVLVPGAYDSSNPDKTATANVGNMIGGYRNKIQGGSANILTGEDNTIEGFTGSSLFGKSLTASTNYQTIVGVYNADAGTNLFVVAGGNAESKKNVFSVGKDSITSNVTRFDLGTGQLNSGKIYCSEVNATGVVRAPHIYKGTWTDGTWQNSGELTTLNEVITSMASNGISTIKLTTTNDVIAGRAIYSPNYFKGDNGYANALLSRTEINSAIDTKINALDVTAITGSTTKTITSLSQTDGKISATYSNIAFPVTSVAGRTGAVTLSKSDVGLSNVDNTSDATKKTNFTGSISSGNTGFVTGGSVYTELAKKVDKTTLEALDYSASGSTTKTITSISQTDGKISVTYGNITYPSTVRSVTKSGTTNSSGYLSVGLDINAIITFNVIIGSGTSAKNYSGVYAGGGSTYGTIYLGDTYYILFNPDSTYSMIEGITLYKDSISSKVSSAKIYMKALIG